MNRRSPAQMARARRLLAYESATAGAAGGAAAAALVFEKLRVQLSPLLGSAGVQALFDRSMVLSRVEFTFLDRSAVESAGNLRTALETQGPTQALEAAAALFGAFLTLIGTYVGERLTTGMLRGAWPSLEEPSAVETSK